MHSRFNQRIWQYFQQRHVVNIVVGHLFVASVLPFALFGNAFGTKHSGASTHDPCLNADLAYTVKGDNPLNVIADRPNTTGQHLVQYNRSSNSDPMYINPCLSNSAQGTDEISKNYASIKDRRHTRVGGNKSNVGKSSVGELRVRNVNSDKSTTTVSNGSGKTSGKVRVPTPTPPPVPSNNNGGGPPPSSGQGNPFPYGQCTWWAAERYHQIHSVYVPWRTNANAWQWASRALDFHWHISSSPSPGAIIDLQPGVEGAGGLGHVGVVEQVLSNGHVLVSTMNWAGSGSHVVDVQFSPGPGVTFITQ